MIESTEIPYHSNPEILFSHLQSLSGAVWLDSGEDPETRGRFDILSALPQSIFTENDLQIGETPFSSLQTRIDNLIDYRTAHDTPFTHGYIGYFSYETNSSNKTKTMPDKYASAPRFAWGYYSQSFVFDHHQQKAYFFCVADKTQTESPELFAIINKYKQTLNAPADINKEKIDAENLNNFILKSLTPLWNYTEYKDAFDTIKEHIYNGDLYQANLTQMIVGQFQGNPYQAYSALRQLMPAPFSAYLNFGTTKILSFSPESFLKKKHSKYSTEPIKGTIKRWSETEKDLQAIQDLTSSVKDRAENLMIVDLLRNDLSKNAIVDGISVDELFELKTFSNVHHLVSKITAETQSPNNGMKIFADCFPGGSITGAPKKRSMEIIRRLEPYQRGVYCGSIGYINSRGDFNTNIAIRTITCQNEHLMLSGGGGIVADSDVDTEYAESLTKINRLVDGLKSFSTKDSSISNTLMNKDITSKFN